MTSNDQKIIDMILRAAIVAHRRSYMPECQRLISLAKDMRKAKLFSSKVKLHWAKIEHDMDRELFELGVSNGRRWADVSGDETGDRA